MGSGVVGFNLKPCRALFCDTNPHLISFYQGINSGAITPIVVREFLESEGTQLAKHGADYYYEIRKRFIVKSENKFTFWKTCPCFTTPVGGNSDSRRFSWGCISNYRLYYNTEKSPLDFLFLNRACFNGLIRFNRKGEFNVPFGHKPERFSKAYITKIVNQVEWVAKLASLSDWTLRIFLLLFW